jgi:hypothetical protein
MAQARQQGRDDLFGAEFTLKKAKSRVRYCQSCPTFTRGHLQPLTLTVPMTQLVTEYSPWYFGLCLLVGGLYAFLLYQKEAPWGPRTNRALAGLRLVVATFICFLLLGPFLRQVRNFIEKPTIVIAVDNSQSLPLITDSTRLRDVAGRLDQLAERLRDQNFEVRVQSLADKAQYAQVAQVRYDQPSTNLSDLLGRVQGSFENKNLAGVVLVSDGIYNQGTSPTYTPFKAGIYTVGLGDTLPQRDVSLKNTFHNKIAYLGNQFPIVAEVANAGFAGSETTVVLSQNGKVLETKRISFGKENDLQQVQFLVAAADRGMQHFVLTVSPLGGEFTTRNNTKHVYVDVMDGRERILLLAPAPHPDVKAIRSALEKNENYQVTVYMPNITPEDQFKRNEKYDLVIAHQLPSNASIAASNLLKEFAKKLPVWYVYGSEMSLANFNALAEIVAINANGTQTDKVTPSFNNGFNKFNFSDQHKAALTKFPPVVVPFGNFRLGPSAEVLLYQRVGSLQTTKPLLVVGETEGRKSAVMLGEGLWQWRLQEYAKNGSPSAFDDLATKLVQYLSAKEDKRKFRVYPSASEYFSTDPVEFETEAYNDIYEKIYGQKVDLVLTSEAGKTINYTYVNSAEGFRYRVAGLPQGVYRYRASTTLGGKAEVASGEFTVKEMQLEALNTTADFGMLRQLAQQTGGGFYAPERLGELTDRLTAEKSASIIHSTEEMRELLHRQWLFFLLVGLLSVEWFVRKFRGAY